MTQESKSELTLALAEELLEDIELARLPTEALLRKGYRLARLADLDRMRSWIEAELFGYSSANPLHEEHMGYTGRWTDKEKNWVTGSP